MNHLASAEGRLPPPRQTLEVDRLDPQILLSHPLCCLPLEEELHDLLSLGADHAQEEHAARTRAPRITGAGVGVDRASSEERSRTVGLFTVSFELGEKTREMLMEIAGTSVIRFELGPETRSMIERLASSGEGGGRVVGGLVKKGADALRPT
jgi:hypothetical protein